MKVFSIGVCFILSVICLQSGFSGETEHAVAENECVILLHGLGRTKYSMNKIESRLKEIGYSTVNYGYPSTEENIEALADVHLSEAVNCCRNQSARIIHFITHSLGGILVRQYLQKNSIPEGGRVIMLSPPNKGSELTDKLKDTLLYKWVTGPAGQQLGTDETSVPSTLKPIDVEIGIIIGDKSLEPWFSSLIPGDDDGKVSVDRAKLHEMSDFLVVDSAHTFIMRNPEVIDQIEYFLKHGTFRKSPFETKNLNQTEKK